MKKTYPLFLLCFWVVVLVNVFISVIPVPSNIKFKSKQSFYTLFPQGWGFFTRNPLECQLLIMKTNDVNHLNVLEPNSSLSSLFGISRINRVRNIEVALILKKIKTKHWKYSKGGEWDFDDKIKCDTVENNFSPKTVHGHYYFLWQKRIPWAWAKYSKLIMPYKYVKVYVK